MFISISGTPGTGKTAVAKILAKMTGARLITTDYLLEKYKIKTSLDKKRKTKIIDAKKLAAAAKKEFGQQDTIFEGHLAHFARADLTIILRASPRELEKRLSKKKWRKEKVRENVEAEALGIISGEARKHSIEIDTTGKTPENVSLLAVKLLNNYSLQKKYLKKIDWSKEYIKYLRD